MKLKQLKPKTLFIYKSPKKLKKYNETDPTTSTADTLTTTGIFGI